MQESQEGQKKLIFPPPEVAPLPPPPPGRLPISPGSSWSLFPLAPLPVQGGSSNLEGGLALESLGPYRFLILSPHHPDLGQAALLSTTRGGRFLLEAQGQGWGGP